jgi:hypothetical protein
MNKLLIIFGILYMAGCETEGEVPAESKIVVKENESRNFSIDGKTSEIKITEIQDSRCPENANCVRAGEVIVRFDLEIGGDKTKGLELCLQCENSMNIPASAQINGHTLTLLEVSPYPNASVPVGQRTATFSLQ